MVGGHWDGEGDGGWAWVLWIEAIPPPTDGNWVKEGQALRKSLGKTTTMSPWTSSQRLLGYRSSPRVTEVIDCAFLAMTAQSGNKDDRDFLVDTSQNPSRKPWTRKVPSLKQNTDLYSFKLRRRIVPVEHLRIMGYGDVDVHDLKHEEIRSLAGECMSVPCVSLILLAICYGGHLQGLWQKPLPVDPTLDI